MVEVESTLCSTLETTYEPVSKLVADGVIGNECWNLDDIDREFYLDTIGA